MPRYRTGRGGVKIPTIPTETITATRLYLYMDHLFDANKEVLSESRLYTYMGFIILGGAREKPDVVIKRHVTGDLFRSTPKYLYEVLTRPPMATEGIVPLKPEAGAEFMSIGYGDQHECDLGLGYPVRFLGQKTDRTVSDLSPEEAARQGRPPSVRHALEAFVELIR